MKIKAILLPLLLGALALSGARVQDHAGPVVGNAVTEGGHAVDLEDYFGFPTPVPAEEGIPAVLHSGMYGADLLPEMGLSYYSLSLAYLSEDGYSEWLSALEDASFAVDAEDSGALIADEGKSLYLSWSWSLESPRFSLVARPAALAEDEIQEELSSFLTENYVPSGPSGIRWNLFAPEEGQVHFRNFGGDCFEFVNFWASPLLARKALMESGWTEGDRGIFHAPDGVWSAYPDDGRVVRFGTGDGGFEMNIGEADPEEILGAEGIDLGMFPDFLKDETVLYDYSAQEFLYFPQDLDSELSYEEEFERALEQEGYVFYEPENITPFYGKEGLAGGIIHRYSIESAGVLGTIPAIRLRIDLGFGCCFPSRDIAQELRSYGADEEIIPDLPESEGCHYALWSIYGLDAEAMFPAIASSFREKGWIVTAESDSELHFLHLLGDLTFSLYEWEDVYRWEASAYDWSRVSYSGPLDGTLFGPILLALGLPEGALPDTTLEMDGAISFDDSHSIATIDLGYDSLSRASAFRSALLRAGFVSVGEGRYLSPDIKTLVTISPYGSQNFTIESAAGQFSKNLDSSLLEDIPDAAGFVPVLPQAEGASFYERVSWKSGSLSASIDVHGSTATIEEYGTLLAEYGWTADPDQTALYHDGTGLLSVTLEQDWESEEEKLGTIIIEFCPVPFDQEAFEEALLSYGFEGPAPDYSSLALREAEYGEDGNGLFTATFVSYELDARTGDDFRLSNAGYYFDEFFGIWIDESTGTWAIFEEIGEDGEKVTLQFGMVGDTTPLETFPMNEIRTSISFYEQAYGVQIGELPFLDVEFQEGTLFSFSPLGEDGTFVLAYRIPYEEDYLALLEAFLASPGETLGDGYDVAALMPEGTGGTTFTLGRYYDGIYYVTLMLLSPDSLLFGGLDEFLEFSLGGPVSDSLSISFEGERFAVPSDFYYSDGWAEVQGYFLGTIEDLRGIATKAAENGYSISWQDGGTRLYFDNGDIQMEFLFLGSYEAQGYISFRIFGSLLV